ncbi:MAG: carotenoid 1,2-hydratase [Proteobacteria bacterium]|nr:carotenoid 1,2-hydratase [Pseudomonadota bacterium]
MQAKYWQRILAAALASLVISAHADPTMRSGRLDILQDVEEQGYRRAETVRPFRFPADHGPHPGYRLEWWYVTGNLDGPAGRRFGFELTFFRLALAPETSEAVREPQSAWKTRLAFAAHFAITDVANDAFQFAHRYSRGDGRLAGATGNPVRVWLEDWFLERSGEGWRLHAKDGALRLTLELSAVKPPAFHGERGLSRKSAEPGNATYYYSLPRLESSGALEIEGRSYAVQGLAWLDHEWGTSALASDQQGWDWYALHLSDGSDLMFYNLRKLDGSRHAFSAGTWIEPDGETTTIGAGDLAIETLDYWDSPLGGRYPSGWRLTWPARDLELTIQPVVKDQELNTRPRYWEGAVDVAGQRRGVPLHGRGYVELTGYAQ